MSGDIKSLAEYTNSGKMRSPEQCLQDCLEEIGNRGAFKNR